LLHVPDLPTVYAGRPDYPDNLISRGFRANDQEGIKGNTEIINLQCFKHLSYPWIDERERILLPHYHTAPCCLCHLKYIAPKTPVGHIGHGVDMIKYRIFYQRFTGQKKGEIDSLFDNLGEPGIDRRRRNRS